MHASMDLPNRIGELEPKLIEESELMHRRCLQRDSAVELPVLLINRTTETFEKPTAPP